MHHDVILVLPVQLHEVGDHRPQVVGRFPFEDPLVHPFLRKPLESLDAFLLVVALPLLRPYFSPECCSNTKIAGNDMEEGPDKLNDMVWGGGGGGGAFAHSLDMSGVALDTSNITSMFICRCLQVLLYVPFYGATI